MSTISEWEGGGEERGKEDNDCIDKDGDGVQSIFSSRATTITSSVLTPETVANNAEGGME